MIPKFTLLQAIVLLVLLKCSVGQIFTMRSVSPPATCVGGQSCLFQPSVAVVDSTGAIDVTFTGSAYAQMETSPSGFESLYVGDCDTVSCGTVVFGTSASAPFVNGVAQFEVGSLIYFVDLHSLNFACRYS